MADPIFPSNIKPVINQGYDWNAPNNVLEQPVAGGLSLMILDTKFGYVDFNVTIVGNLLKQQAFNDFYVNKIDRGSAKFTMELDSGNGLQDHTCNIVPSTLRQGGPNDPTRIISFVVRAITPFQSDPYEGGLADLYAIYGEGLPDILGRIEIFTLDDLPEVFSP